MSDRPVIVVFGGSGYLGQAICRECINRGIHVYSVSRRGQPVYSSSSSLASTCRSSTSWMSSVEWLTGDVSRASALDSSIHSALSQSTAVIDAIGAFGSVEYMRAVNGKWNIELIQQCKALHVPRFVYISAHHYPLPQFLQQGYFEGKKSTEKALNEAYGRDGVVIRPSAIAGVRTVKLPLSNKTVGVPLHWLLSPHSWLCSSRPVTAVAKAIRPVPLLGPLSEFVLLPSVPVESVAKAAVSAALDSKVSGVLDVPDILGYQPVDNAKMK